MLSFKTLSKPICQTFDPWRIMERIESGSPFPDSRSASFLTSSRFVDPSHPQAQLLAGGVLAVHLRHDLATIHHHDAV